MNTCSKPNLIFKNQDNKWEFLTHKKYTKGILPKETQIFEIPCGNCKACLKNQSLKFKQRLLLMKEESKTSYFITLTYNDHYLKDKSTHINELREFTKKIKNHYRNNYGITGIKFFGVSEYGDLSMRPHYHIIMFNLPIWDYDFLLLKTKKTPKKSKIAINKWINQDYFTNSIIKKLWQKGNITITTLNETRINYIVSYLFKSMNGITKKKREEAYKLKMELPKRIQSQNLGLNTILNNKNEFLNNNYMYINGEKIYANSYIDKKANIYNDERLEKRLVARLNKIGKNKQSILNNHKGCL